MLVRGAGIPLAFAANLLIARFLGPEKFGLYITLLSVALVGGGLAAYGLGPVLTREISAVNRAQQPETIRSLGSWALRFFAILSVVVMLLTLAWLALGPGAPSSTWPERIGAVSIIPLFGASTIIAGVLSGLSQVARSQSVGMIWKNGGLLIGATLLLALGADRPLYVLLMQTVSFALAVMVAVHWIRRFTPGSAGFRRVWSKPSIEPQRARMLRRSARHFLAMSLTWLVLGRLDVVIVNALAGTTQAGYFGVAARLGQFGAMAGLIWGAWLQPRISARYHSGQSGGLRRLLSLGLLGAITMTAVLVIAGWFGAPQLMKLMGPSFDEAVMPFRWLLLGYLPWAASVPFFAYLTMSGHEKLVSWILWFQVVLTLAVSVPLITSFGALGGAWAWAGGTGIASLIMVSVGIFTKSRPLPQGQTR